MRVIVDVSVRVEEVGHVIFDRLRHIHPIDPRLTIFDLRLPETDPRVSAAIAELEGAGFRPWEDKTRPLREGLEYRLRRWREYNNDDFERCAYLRIEPPDAIGNVNRDERGMIILVPDDLRVTTGIARSQSGGLVVPDRVRRLLESSTLRGMAFRATMLRDDPMRSDNRLQWGTTRFPDAWWELTSPISLPPLESSVLKTDFKGVPVPRDFRAPVLLQEPPYFGVAEFHYLASELRRAESFDLARSFETGSIRPDDRWFVASKRFYEFCKENKIKCGWVPVRIDEG